jgi:hypothetical protein
MSSHNIRGLVPWYTGTPDYQWDVNVGVIWAALSGLQSVLSNVETIISRIYYKCIVENAMAIECAD